MGSLRIEAQDMLEIARDGIGWIALWKEGRAWYAMSFWPDYDERTSSAEVDDFELDQLRTLAEKHPDAIFVNGWLHNLGDPDEMTRDSLADALRWQYGLQNYLLADFVRNVDIKVI